MSALLENSPQDVPATSMMDRQFRKTVLFDEILLRYLRAEIYCYPDADPPTKRLTAFDRFRA